MTDRKHHHTQPLTLDPRRRLLTIGDKQHALTHKECRLLQLFLEHPQEVLSRRFLMKAVWDTEYLGDTRTLTVHVCWLREKLGDHPPRRLITVRGVGYCFNGPA